MSNNKSRPDSHGTLVKSTAVLAAGTLASRALGFLRNIIIAKFFGTGLRADVFFLALRIPNLFRDLVGEGAANSAVVPVLSEYQVKHDSREVWKLVNVLSLWALIILSSITLLGMIYTPFIISLMAPGFSSDPQKVKLAVDATRLMFPYLVFIGLTAHSMAVLYTFRSFTSAAFSPCLFNICVIIAALWSRQNMAEPVYGLAIGVLVGGILQLAAQIPSMSKAGLSWQKAKLNHPGARQCGKLLLPRLFGSGVYQLNLVVDTICASLSDIVGPGGISAIFYANQLIQLPLGVFGFAMSTASLPVLSTMVAQNDMDKFKKTMVFSLENLFFIMFPISILFISLAHPMVQVLYQRGEFGSYSTSITSLALVFFSLGLFSFSGSRILTTGYYALKDTQTPVKVALGALVLNIVLIRVLIYPMGIGGIALASSVSSTVSFFVLLNWLEKRVGLFSKTLWNIVVKVIAASIVAGGFLQFAEDYWNDWHIRELYKIVLEAAGAFFVYLIMCFALRVPQTRYIWRKIFRKN